MTGPARTTMTVRAVDHSMRRLGLPSLVALMVSYVVRRAIERHDDLVKATLAELDATMHECNGCRTEREKAGKSPRTLVPLPKAIFDEVFKVKESWLVCEYCDGDLLELALREHAKRS